MGFNKKVLSQIKSDLNSAKPPARKKDIIVDPAGQWKYPGQNTRIPSNNITMQGVDYPVFAQPNIGQPQMMYPGQDYNFPGADYVDEYPQMKKGGQKKYSRSLEATNKLFTANPFVKKKKSKKKKIFNPKAKYYQDGGESRAEELLGPIPLNSGRKTLRDWTYGQSIGMLQEQDGGETDYIELDLTPEEIEEYKKGGYVVEDISIPSLTRFTEGGNKRKKKKQTEPEEDFKFTANTELYKRVVPDPNDPSKQISEGNRAYAKSDDGKWYEYKTYDAGFNEEGDRLTQGYFTPIDESYDIEKNLSPYIVPMSEDEKMGIKMGTKQLGNVTVKGKRTFKDKVRGVKRKLFDALNLSPEEQEMVINMYNNDMYDAARMSPGDPSHGGAHLPQNFDEWFTYKISSDEDWKRFVDESFKKNKTRRYDTLYDAAVELQNQKKQDEELRRNYNPDPTSKPQSAQASDWLWTMGVLGGAGAGAGALGDLGALANTAYTSPVAGTSVSLADLAYMYGAGNIGKEWLIDPLFTGKTPDFNAYNIISDLSTVAAPFNQYLNALSTAGTLGSDIEGGLNKGTLSQSADDAIILGNALRKTYNPGIRKQYGGESNYEVAELTPAEIEEYRRQGYIVEEY
jgi:hypothetical protein